MHFCGMTEKEYQNNLDFLIAHSPNHPLINELSAGWSDLNVIYLDFILQSEDVRGKIKDVGVKSEDVRLKIKDVVIEPPTIQDGELKKLYIEKSRLFTERAKLSNRLHEFPLNAKHNVHRAGVMDEIRVKQNLIERIFRTIEYYEANGRMPSDGVVDERFPIPADLYERRLKLNAVNASLSRWKKELHEAIAKGNHKRAEEIGVYMDEYTVYKRAIIGAFKADGVDIIERKKGET